MVSLFCCKIFCIVLTSFVEALVWLLLICIIDSQGGTKIVVKNKIKSSNLRDDVVKKLLTDSWEGRKYLACMISAVLNKPVAKLNMVHPNIGVNKNVVNGEADIVLESNNFIVNVEINNFNSLSLSQNNFSYICHLILRQLKKSKDYKRKIKYIYQINLNNFGVMNDKEFIVRSKILDDKKYREYRKYLMIVDINLAKLRNMDYTDIKKKGKASLEYLLYLLVCEDEDVLKKLYKGDELMEAMVDKGIELTLNFDAGLRYDAQKLREYSLIEVGQEQGKRNKEEDVVRRMLKKKFNIGVISEITGLSKKEINKLKREETVKM